MQLTLHPPSSHKNILTLDEIRSFCSERQFQTEAPRPCPTPQHSMAVCCLPLAPLLFPAARMLHSATGSKEVLPCTPLLKCFRGNDGTVKKKVKFRGRVHCKHCTTLSSRVLKKITNELWLKFTRWCTCS